jgi:hypothetical protein
MIGPEVVKPRFYAYESGARRMLLDRRVQQVECLFPIAQSYLTDRQIVRGNKSALSSRPQTSDQVQGF